jgi:hypothetical protein
MRIYLLSPKKEKNEIQNRSELSSLLFVGFSVSSSFYSESAVCVRISFLFVSSRCEVQESLPSLSLSLSPSLPPGALFSPGANGLRGQAWPQPMGKRGD